MTGLSKEFSYSLIELFLSFQSRSWKEWRIVNTWMWTLKTMADTCLSKDWALFWKSVHCWSWLQDTFWRFSITFEKCEMLGLFPKDRAVGGVEWLTQRLRIICINQTVLKFVSIKVTEEYNPKSWENNLLCGCWGHCWLFYNSYSTNQPDIKDIKMTLPGGINKPTFEAGMGWNTLRSDKK